ncbi:MAG: AlpA family phage regulatory protein [Ramlibacter sp.]|nr:AlpA family phage regulatory protein [Ramlibacter sp.]
MPHAQETTAFSSSPEPAFYRLADVIRITALSRSSIYRRIAAGEFPLQVSLGGRATGWRREALQAWIGDPAGFRPLTVSNGMDAPTRNGIRVPQWKCHQPLNRKGRPP